MAIKMNAKLVEIFSKINNGTTHKITKLPKRLAKMIATLPVLASILLLFVIYLISSSFVSQMKLQKRSLDELVFKTDTYAKSLSYFYSERLRDVNYLAELTEIKTYFDNLALGMTPEYGLTASLVNVEEKFNQFINENKVQIDSHGEARQIYKVIFFLQANKTILAKSQLPSNVKNLIEPGYINQILAHEKSSTVNVFWVPDSKNGELREFITSPYWYKNTYMGQIVAEVSQGIFDELFIRKSSYILSFDGHPIDLSACSQCKDDGINSAYFQNIWRDAQTSDRYIKFAAPSGTSYLGVKVGIERSPFVLVKLSPSHEVFGTVSPWLLLVGMIGMLVLIFAGVVANFRSRAQRIAAEQQTIAKDKALVTAVQSFFFPHEPHMRFDNIEVGGFYKSADEASGDWWWYGYTPDKKMLTVVMGDVTGHGAASAMLTASVAASFKNLEKYKSLSDLEGILNELNSIFLEYAQEKYNMTFAAINFNPSEMKLSYWNAGAPPIFRMNRETGVFKSIKAASTPLGSKNFTLGHEEVALSPGDRFFFYTDGVSELELPDGRQMRSKALSRILDQTRSLDVKTSIQFLQDELDKARQQTPLKDDMTFAIVDVPSSAELNLPSAV